MFWESLRLLSPGVNFVCKKDMTFLAVVFPGMVIVPFGWRYDTRTLFLSVEAVYWVKGTSYLWVAFLSSCPGLLPRAIQLMTRKAFFH